MAAPTVVVLTHLRQGLQHNSMVGRLLREVWQPAGLRVLVQQGLRDAPPADLAILHVDLTVVPDDYLALGAGYPRCLNLATADTSKRRISRALVERGDPYEGPVIVKTDRNWGGRQERWLAEAEGSWRARLAARLPSRWSGRLPGDDYQVFARKAEVPRWVWRSPALVVERLVSERLGESFVMHQWYFFGEADCVCSVVGPTPFVTFENRVALLPLHGEVPDPLRQRRRELGFDCGKFDYVVTEDGPVLFDANRTPAIDDPELGRVGRLGRGLESFLA